MTCPKCGRDHDGDGWPIETPTGLQGGCRREYWKEQIADLFWEFAQEANITAAKKRIRLIESARQLAAKSTLRFGGE